MPAKALPLNSGLTAADHPMATESLITEAKGGRGGRGKRDNDLIDIDIGGGKGGPLGKRKRGGLCGGLL